MTRNVFDNDSVAHVWAQNEQDSGRSQNGQFYFEGPALYSYGSHYLVGFILPTGRAFINADSNSPTTNRHVSRARSAVRHRDALEVPNLTELAAALRWAAAQGGDKRVGLTSSDAAALAKRFADKVAAWAVETYAARLSYGSFVPAPPLETLAPVLEAFGMARKAPALTRKIEATNRKAQAQASKLQDERNARDANAWAAVSPADLGGRIARELAQTWGEPLDALNAWSREMFQALKWAKGRKGWIRKAQAIKANRAQVRAAVNLELARRERRQERAAASNGIASLRAGLGVLDKGETLEPGRVWAFANGRGDWSDKGNAQGDGAETVNARERAAYLVAQGVRQVLAGGPLAQAQRDALEALAARVEPLEAQAQAARAERVRIAAELEAAERLERERETRESWIAGGAVRFYGRDALGGAYLRAVGVERNESGDITGGTLETSQGANVPLVHALRAFRFLKHCRETGTPWQRNGRTIRVGFYHVDSVAPDGSFVAGCHRINWPQVEVVALALGVADLAPDSSVATPTNATA